MTTRFVRVSCRVLSVICGTSGRCSGMPRTRSQRICSTATWAAAHRTHDALFTSHQFPALHTRPSPHTPPAPLRHTPNAHSRPAPAPHGASGSAAPASVCLARCSASASKRSSAALQPERYHARRTYVRGPVGRGFAVAAVGRMAWLHGGRVGSRTDKEQRDDDRKTTHNDNDILQRVVHLSLGGPHSQRDEQRQREPARGHGQLVIGAHESCAARQRPMKRPELQQSGD